MNEHDLKELVADVKAGKLPRRRFVQMMVGLGFTAPMATQLLSWHGVAMAQTKSTYKPTKRGGGGPLKVLWWQGATLLPPGRARNQMSAPKPMPGGPSDAVHHQGSPHRTAA